MGAQDDRGYVKPGWVPAMGQSISLDPASDSWDIRHVMEEAYTIYVNRDAERNGLWKRDGRDKMVGMAYDKTLRLLDKIEESNEEPFNEDDALDAINYLAFAILNQRAGRIRRSRRDG